MLQRLMGLYTRYVTAHIDFTQPGQAIIDQAGKNIGYVDSIRLRAGRLQVVGWAQATSLRLVLAGSDVTAAPTLRREDVASALGLPPALGFDMSVPASLASLDNSAPPGLVVTTPENTTSVNPISLAVALSKRYRAQLVLGFGWALIACLPTTLRWALSRDPTLKARIQSRMGLKVFQSVGMIDPALLPADTGPVQWPVQPLEGIDIVMPVYNAFDHLQDCLKRVVAHTDLPYRLILVEDSSTDTRILPFLRDWTSTHTQHVELLENSKNLGFIGAVNRGLAHALKDKSAIRPIVLLNSDAFVPAGWASRLVAPLADPTVATVTPMSNDAEIFSVPAICVRTMLVPGQGDAIDAVAGRIAPDAPEIVVPTGVGFCMAIGRQWLSHLPRLDPTFGRGYGEEVDWCQKIARKGGRHIGLPRLFVEHRGGESFGLIEKAALIAKNSSLVERRYPGYNQVVNDFISTDPILTARLTLGMIWAGTLDPDRAIPVYLAHAMGGGAEHWLDHQVTSDLEMGNPSIILRVGTQNRWRLELITMSGRVVGSSDEVEDIIRLLGLLPRKTVIYSCGVGDPDPLQIPAILAGLVKPEDRAQILFHDYFPLSPSYTLLDSDGYYRGPARLPRADPAHSVQRPDGTTVALRDWQTAWTAFAARADLVVFSEDSRAQVAAVWPRLKHRILLKPHISRHNIPRLPATPPNAHPVLAVLGDIGQQKGAAVVQRLAQLRAQDGKGPRLVFIGKIDPAFDLSAACIVHGSYDIADLPNLVCRYGITHWLIPSIWPETYCFTVHEALATGLPVMAFGIGAQGEAVRTAKNGIEMPFDIDADLAQTVRDCMAA